MYDVYAHIVMYMNGFDLSCSMQYINYVQYNINIATSNFSCFDHTFHIESI